MPLFRIRYHVLRGQTKASIIHGDGQWPILITIVLDIGGLSLSLPRSSLMPFPWAGPATLAIGDEDVNGWVSTAGVVIVKVNVNRHFGRSGG